MTPPPRATPLTTTSYAVLGLLSLEPMSAYELSGALDGGLHGIWTTSRSQVYNEVRRLEQAGLVAGTDVAGSGAPDKRVFRLTDDGADAVDRWLEQAGAEPARLRLPDVLRVLMGHRVDPAVTVRLLFDMAASAQRRRSVLVEALVDLERVPGSEFARLGVEFEIEFTDAVIRWAARAHDRLPAAPVAGENPDVARVLRGSRPRREPDPG